VRLVVFHNGQSGDNHAVVAARVDGDWLILDNRHLRLLVDNEVVGMTPLAALGEDEDRSPATAAVDAAAWPDV
jgi:hypothetical protein